MKKFKDYLNEDLNNALVEPEGDASAQAKKLGLVYVGFGRYENPNTQQITHVVQNNKLVPYASAVKSNVNKTMSADDYGGLQSASAPEADVVHSGLVATYSPDNYTPEELDAVQTYVDGGYDKINQTLAVLPTLVPADQLEPDLSGDNTTDHIAALDSALNKVALPADIIVYVGLGTDYNITDFAPGTTFSFKTFRSTTLDLTKALNTNSLVTKSANREQTVLLQIRLPKGTKGIYADDYSSEAGDSEFILPRGSKVKVTAGPSKLVGSNAGTGSQGLEVLYFDCTIVK